MLGWPLRSPLHERPDGGGGGVEDRETPYFSISAPEAVPLRPVRGAFVQEHRRAVGQRAVDDIGMPRHPADIGGTPVHVVVFEVEDVLGGRGHACQIPARRVQNAFRLARRAGRVQGYKAGLRRPSAVPACLIGRHPPSAGATRNRALLHGTLLGVVSPVDDDHFLNGRFAFHGRPPASFRRTGHCRAASRRPR